MPSKLAGRRRRGGCSPASRTMASAMRTATLPWLAGTLVVLLAGCATRAVNVAPVPVSPAEFMVWDCGRIDDERDLVQQRATEVAWTVDEKAGNNILALGMGVTVFWPAMLAMRPDGPEAAELARLKGRYEALAEASRDKACPPPGDELPAARAAALPLVLGEKLVYEDRVSAKGPASAWVLRVSALRRGEIEYRQTDVASVCSLSVRGCRTAPATSPVCRPGPCCGHTCCAATWCWAP